MRNGLSVRSYKISDFVGRDISAGPVKSKSIMTPFPSSQRFKRDMEKSCLPLFTKWQL